MAICGRYTDRNSHIRARVNPTGFKIFSFVSGAYTELGSYSISPVAGTVYKLGLKMNGTSIKGYIDDVEIISGTSSESLTVANHGIFSDSANSAIVDNFNLDAI